MRYESMITMENSFLYIFPIILSCISSLTYSDSIAPPGPYSIPVDGALFVMLTGRCEKLTEVHGGLTKHESQVLREQINARLKEEKNKITSMPILNSCEHLNGRVSHRANDHELWKLSIETFKWKPKASLSNDAGDLYPESGLYPVDGSVVPIWTVNWHARNVLLSKDGRYLIRLGPWASNYDDLAVAFYDNGVLIRAYAIKDLVRDPEKLPRSVSHFQWDYEMQFDEDKNILHLSTYGNEIYELDVTTGLLMNISYKTLPVFTVDAVNQSGKHYTLSDFQSTIGSYVSLNNGALGESPRQYIFGWETIEPHRGDGKSTIREYRIPFSDIARLTRTDDSNNDALFWRIRFRSGDEQVIQVYESCHPMCRFTGKTSSGETVELQFQDINLVVFR